MLKFNCIPACPVKTLPTILACKNQAELDTKKNSIMILMEYGN